MNKPRHKRDPNARIKKLLLDQLRKIPIIQIACEKAGIGRTTYYRWCKEDADFAKAAEDALIEGEAFVTDLSESQLITLIREKNFSAIRLWLKSHHAKYRDKLDLTAMIGKTEPLSPEQEATLLEAISMTSFKEEESEEEENEDGESNEDKNCEKDENDDG